MRKRRPDGIVVCTKPFRPPRLVAVRLAVVALCFLVAPIRVLCGASLADPGFENYAVGAGGFVKPASGSWLFTNDAGVVEPYSPNSSNGTLDTWSAAFTAYEGLQYASTYAGGDSIRQSVAFDTAGDYLISVYAAAPDGSVTIPSIGTLQLVDGEFTFTLAGTAIGSPHTVARGSSWNSYSAVFTIGKPGSYLLGTNNTLLASYFINYDSFSVQSVPEPSMVALLTVAAATLLFMAWPRRKC
jgi:hypothetical protein